MTVFTLKLAGEFFTLSLVLLGVFYIYAKWNLSYWKRRGVPSPPTNFIAGNMGDTLLLKSSPSKLFGKIHEYAGSDSPYVGFYVLHRPCLLIRDPELIKSILVRDFEVFTDRYFGMHAKKKLINTQNLFSIQQPKWKYLRSKLSPALSSGKLKKMIPLMVENAREMTKFIEAQPEKKENSKVKALKIKDTSMRYTTDVIASLAFGIKTNSFETPEPEFLTQTVEAISTSAFRSFELFLLFFFSEFSDIIGSTLLRKTAPYFRRIFWSSVETREKSGNTRGDLIDYLIALKNDKQSSEFKFDGDNLLAQSAIFFVAGLDTSATTMAFALLELAKHPEFQDQVRREIKEKLRDHDLTLEAFQEMKYLNQVISETLRIYPPAPIIDRVANRDYKIPGSNVIIEKGTPVYVSLEGLHKNPKYHPDPLKFDPDRFSNERKKLITSMTYMPFGEGPRICIGQRIGLSQVSIGLAMILSEWEVFVDPDKETVIDPKEVFLKTKDDINLLLKKIHRSTD